ncbi:MAG TPA: glycosyltransferase, partial [bacterium]|nr:glycosyltransferase [bacterium]
MKTVIMVPTYNERANVGELVRLLHKSVPQAQVLIVDDSSPDGTYEEVKKLMKKDKRLHLLLRDRSIKGRGWAGRDGFVKALQMGAEAVVEMDADLSHQPKFIPALLATLAAKQADVVIGSRYIPGGKDMDRPFHRQWTSNFARHYLKFVLGLKVKDPTSGFRAFSKDALKKIKVGTLTARDPFTVSEILYRCYRAGLRVQESPIVFIDRTRGESKLGLATLLKYLGRALLMRLSTDFPAPRVLISFLLLAAVVLGTLNPTLRMLRLWVHQDEFERHSLNFSVDGVPAKWGYAAWAGYFDEPLTRFGSNEWGPVGELLLKNLPPVLNHNIEGGPLVINTTSFPSGIGTHAPGKIDFPLQGKFSRFSCKVGLDAASVNSRGAIYTVIA